MQADLNEAAGAAADSRIRDRLRDIVVTEKGDFCENTYPADARRARTPQLRCHDDSVVPESGRAFPTAVNTPLDELGPDDLRSYHAYLLGDRKLAVNTVVLNVCALRFLYIKVLKRRDMKEDLPYLKERMRLPVILSPGEVAQLIGAARNLYHRTMLMTFYSTGLRRAELCRLKVSGIDSKRMMLRVEQGKGGIDREVPLSKKLLGTGRTSGLPKIRVTQVL